jgi:hypothetical protein
MARPKKNTDELRVHQTNIRMTNSERIYAQQQALLAGLTIATWLRIAAFSKKALKVHINPLHREYYRQLIGIATNINQISHKINQGVHTKIHHELIQVRELLTKILNELINDNKTT